MSKKWAVFASEIVYYSLRIEADTKEEASEIAKEIVEEYDIIGADGFTIDVIAEIVPDATEVEDAKD